jgi:hypothetical protein
MSEENQDLMVPENTIFNERPLWYLLDTQGNPYPAKSGRDTGELLRNVEKRRVGHTEKVVAGHDVWLSTVFLVFDHGCPEIDGDAPVLFESMLFIDNHEIASATRRYTTRDLALKGHNEIAELLEELVKEVGKKTHVAGVLTRILDTISTGEDA